MIEAAVLDVLVHDVRDGHAAIEVVDHERAAGSAPARDALPLDVRSIEPDGERAFEAEAESPSQRIAGHEIGPFELKVECTLASSPGQERHAAHAPAG